MKVENVMPGQLEISPAVEAMIWQEVTTLQAQCNLLLRTKDAEHLERAKKTIGSLNQCINKIPSKPKRWEVLLPIVLPFLWPLFFRTVRPFKVKATTDTEKITEGQFHMIWRAALGMVGYQKALFRELFNKLEASGNINVRQAGGKTINKEQFYVLWNVASSMPGYDDVLFRKLYDKLQGSKFIEEPDFGKQLQSVLKRLYKLREEYQEMELYNSKMEKLCSNEILQREYHQRWTLCLRFHNDLDTMINEVGQDYYKERRKP